MKYFNDEGNLGVEKSYIFDEDGYLKEDVEEEVDVITEDKNLSYRCDAVRLMFADLYANRTHGNYSTETLYMRAFGRD